MRTSAALVGLLLLTADGPEKPQLSELQVALNGQQVMATVQLHNSFTDRMLERLHSGLPTGFVFKFELYRGHKWWFDNRLRRSRLEVLAMFNAVSREYMVNFKHDGKLIDTQVVRDLTELEAAMTVLDMFPVLDLGDVNARRRLTLRAQAELGRKTFMLMIPTKIETDWVTSRRFNAPEAVP